MEFISMLILHQTSLELIKQTIKNVTPLKAIGLDTVHLGLMTIMLEPKLLIYEVTFLEKQSISLNSLSLIMGLQKAAKSVFLTLLSQARQSAETEFIVEV